MENNLLEILNELLKTKSYKNIATELNVAIGTVKRWSLLKNVPKQYCFDLMKLANIPIDYTKYTYREKDQFFTSKETADYCYSKFKEIANKYGDNLSEYIFIEPSAGDGVFLKLLPEYRRIGLDIEPRNDEIKCQDYLKWQPKKDSKIIVIGNPPFGLRGQLALKFINHSSDFADYVCFILPQLFESDGKGVPRKRVKNLNLVHSETLHTYFKDPNGKEIKVECIFQVWSKYHKNNIYDIKEIDTSIMKIYSLSDGGTPSSTRNKKMFNKCDIYIPSTCFGKDKMRYYESFDTLPRRKGYGVVFYKEKEKNIEKFKEIDWTEVAFLSTNSAYNIRSSQIIEVFS
jgi:hypothetical protein